MADETVRLTEFGRWFIEQRKALDVTQQEMADRIGVSRVQVSRWEGGHSRPRIDHIPQMASILGLSPDEVYQRAGYSPLGFSDMGSWALSLAKRIEKRASHLAPERRRALERAIDCMLAATG